MSSSETLQPDRTTRSRRRALARLAPALLSAVISEGPAGHREADPVSRDRAGSNRVLHVLADLLPEALGARRVVIGISTGVDGPIRVRVVSGQATLDARRRAVQRQAACLEAMAVPVAPLQAGDAGIRTWPDEASGQGQAACDAYAGGCAASSLACLTLHDASGGRLVLLFDRGSGDERFTAGELVPLHRALPDIGGWLLHAARHDGPWRRRASGAWQRSGGKLSVWTRLLPSAITDALTPRHAVCLAAAATLVLIGALPVSRTVTALVTLEAEHRQLVSAAFDGHLVAVQARAGDRVEKGQLLARLDDRQASDELMALNESARRVDEERSRALALRDRSSLGRLRADQASIAADRAAAQRRVQRSRVTAPFAGVVLASELDERLGSPVRAGERLFELGEDRQLRLMLEIDERDVRLVAPGLPARVRLASLPMQVWNADLEELEPVAIAEPGRNVFRMAATLSGDTDALRPGMRGVARIDTGHRPLAQVWTRALRERLTVLAWRIGWLG